MYYLIASCLSLLFGAIFYQYLSAESRLRKSLDGFIFVTLCGLVVLHILPDIINVGGLVAVILLLQGLLAPTLIERVFKSHSTHARNLTIGLSILGLLLHNLTDGCSIMLAQQTDASIMLAVGVILHRLPEGIAIWWMVQPRMGTANALLVLAIMISMTIIGYFTGGHLLTQLNLESTIYSQAFVTGSILHVLLHQHGSECSTKCSADTELPTRLGGLVGFFIIYLLVASDFGGHHHHDAQYQQSELIIEGK